MVLLFLLRDAFFLESNPVDHSIGEALVILRNHDDIVANVEIAFGLAYLTDLAKNLTLSVVVARNHHVPSFAWIGRISMVSG